MDRRDCLARIIHLLVFGLSLTSLMGTRTASATPPQSISPEGIRLAGNSTFIFRGQVVKLGASNVGLLAADARTVEIRVLKVLHATKAVSVDKGDTLTLMLLRVNSVRAGEQAIFYANGWLYGEHLAVREVGHLPSELTDAQIEEEIAAAQRQREDRRLSERLGQAAVVVVGKVLKTEAFTRAQERSPKTEHDPVWWLAQIAVESVLKGEARKRTLLVAYPTGADVMWAESPRFNPGQQGIFILALPKSLEQTFSGAGAAVYTAIGPLDFQSAKARSRIEDLVKALPRNQAR